MLTEIVSLSEETASQVTSIATAAEQQAAASEEINSSVGDVNRIASENAEAMQQTVSSTRDMADQAEALRLVVDDLKQEGSNTCASGD